MTATSPQTEPEFPTDAAVEAFLREHTDFFERHVALLDVLRLPHRSGGAVSLIERQVALLRDKNRFLEQRLAELVERARENERMGLHLHRLSCTLMHADGLDAVLALTQEALRDELKAELVGIRLVDTEAGSLHRLREADLPHFEELFTRGRAVCGRLPKAQLEAVFESDAETVGSALLMPLVAGGMRTGVLALGSRSPDRFQPDMGTYFVTHLGELLAEAIRCHADRHCQSD
jgi:uncharacterized protein YigA (DUF484 family)